MTNEQSRRVRVAHVFRADHFDIDEVIGVQNIRVQDPVELARLAVSRLGVEFQELAASGAFVVGRRNFGYGHPHVQSTIALRQAGITGIIADSFTPGFWRGSMAMGFMLIACPGICDATQTGDELEFDWQANTVRTVGHEETMGFQSFSDFEERLQRGGGIVALLEEKLSMKVKSS